MTAVKVLGVGGHVPGEPLDNDAMAQLAGPLPPALLPEIGVSRRHWLARPGQDEHPSGVPQMAAAAARQALHEAECSPEEIDLLVISTSSPPFHLPGAATYVLEELGTNHVGTIELRAGCTGFVQALEIGRSQVLAGHARTVLVVGAEAISPAIVGMIDRPRGGGLSLRERLAAYTFGDGAGAAVLRAAGGPNDYTYVQGTLDASLRPGIRVVGGATDRPVRAQDPERLLAVELDPKGSQVHGPRVLAACLEHLGRRGSRALEEVDHVVLPEGDAEYFAEQVVSGVVKVDPDLYRSKVRQNLDDVGATGSAAVALALRHSLDRKEIHEGDSVMLIGIEGARYQYAACTSTWPFL